MSFVIAGVVWLLALLASVVSFLVLPLYEKAPLNEEDSPQLNTPASPAMTISAFCAKENWPQWLFAVLMASLCAVAVYLTAEAGTQPLVLCRQATVAIALLSAMIIDRKTRLIPNLLVVGVLGVGAILLIIECIWFRATCITTLIMSAVGLLACLVLFYVLSRLTRDGIGMGDVKLAAAMGWMLGFASTLTAILFSLILCTVVAVFLLLGKKKNKNDHIPFGPFMFFGYILMLLLFSL